MECGIVSEIVGCLSDVGVADRGKTEDVELDRLTDPWLLGGLLSGAFC